MTFWRHITGCRNWIVEQQHHENAEQRIISNVKNKFNNAVNTMSSSGTKTSSMKFNIIEELGLLSLSNASGDVRNFCAQRFIRLFAYGGSTLVLVLYLRSLGISDERIGAFMTLTLCGDVFISLVLTVVADALGRKAILAGGALLMAASGIVFATNGNYWILLIAAIFGVISPRCADPLQFFCTSYCATLEKIKMKSSLS